MPLDEAKDWLQDLPGVGPKTAAVVLSFALGMPAMPVDTHIHRVARRLGLIRPETSADDAHDVLEEIVPPDDRFRVSRLAHQPRPPHLQSTSATLRRLPTPVTLPGQPNVSVTPKHDTYPGRILAYQYLRDRVRHGRTSLSLDASGGNLIV